MTRLKPAIIIFTIFVLIGCDSAPEQFQIKADRVLEGDYTAIAESPTKILSNYPMVLKTGIDQPLIFKLSLNGQDNEAPFGVNHELLIPGGIIEFYAPTLKFGEYTPPAATPASPINQTTNVHFRVDMHPVLRAFSKDGIYITPTQDTIFADQFTGLFLAGGTLPLRWIWDDPSSPEALHFTDSDQDSIFELTIQFTPPPTEPLDRSWEQSRDLSDLPIFTSPQAPLLEAITTMALEEALLNIREDSTFSAGEAWQGVWTRDISYAGQLSLAYIFPQIVKNSLRAKLNADGRIIQDSGTGGSWPISSDRHLWTLAAWDVFLATGDSLWLAEIRDPVLNALKKDLLWNRDPVSGMLQGETSFEDWREQTYPPWMTPADIHSSHALSTNIIFKRALEIGLGLAQNDPTVINSWPGLINRFDQNILNHFWSTTLSAPASYIITSPSWQPASHRDLLGESLGILFCQSFALVDSQLVASYPRTPYGSPIISHQLPHAPAYHNQAIWPFVEAYSLLSAKKIGNQSVYRHSFNSLIRGAGLFLSHRENFQYATGRPDETAINSDRQLWSVAGWLGAIYKGLFGISVNYNFDSAGFELQLAPNNPFEWDGFSLRQLTLHNTPISIELLGSGAVIKSLLVNGESVKPGTSLPLNGKALHIVIQLGKTPRTSAIQLADFRLPSIPHLVWRSDTLNWSSETDLVTLELNGRILDTLTQSPHILPDTLTGFFSLRAMDSTGTASLPTRPHYQGPSATMVLNAQSPYYVKLGDANAYIKMNFTLPNAGDYLIRFVYANGSGPISTGNSCGLAKLSINDWWLEQMLSFPHTGNWDSWQTTAWAKAQFKAGENTILLDLESLPVKNMSNSINLFNVSSIEIIPVSR